MNSTCYEYFTPFFSFHFPSEKVRKTVIGSRKTRRMLVREISALCVVAEDASQADQAMIRQLESVLLRTVAKFLHR